jgi:cytochrome b6-f complex iron-sulfur subunit
MQRRMRISRRQFLILAAGLAGGCETAKDGVSATVNRGRMVDAGSASSYAADGVYSSFRNRGFFLVRRGDKLFVLSAICTHRKCTLAAEPDRSFYCKCHGSTFDPGGHVTKGPAKRDLPMLSAHTNEEGRLIVDVSAR